MSLIHKTWIPASVMPAPKNGDTFLAAIKFNVITKGDFWWIRLCTTDSAGDLMVICDEENEPAGWETNDIEYWMPIQPPIEQEIPHKSDNDVLLRYSEEIGELSNYCPAMHTEEGKEIASMVVKSLRRAIAIIEDGIDPF